jgi:beta-lactamase superfamily II metal-dependent hydrolase
MYRVGFGDCFLVTLTNAQKEHHILIDCGVHTRGDIKKMGDAVANIRSLTSDRIDIVIATHAHQDHISGFGTYADQFREMTVGEVWMPWTENPSDKEAVRLRKTHFAVVEELTHRFNARDGGRFEAVEHVLLNLASNQTAMKLLQSELGEARVRYVEAGNRFKNPADIEDLTVDVLSPPRDKAFLAKMDPPAAQRYLRLGPEGGAGGAIQPFTKKWKLARQKKQLLLDATYREQLESMAASNSEALAFALDRVINNTSVVALLQFGGEHLLFAGDAQYGNWQYWIEAAGGEDILSRITFYKVAHHGSHNATPKGALEKMSTGDFAAMVSTQKEPWPSIPYGHLMDALERQTRHRVVRSDSLHLQKAPSGPATRKLPRGFKKGSFWYDYTIPLRSEK